MNFSWAKNLGKALQGLGIGAAAVAVQAGGSFVVDNYGAALVEGGVPVLAVTLASPYLTPVIIAGVSSLVNYLKNRNRP